MRRGYKLICLLCIAAAAVYLTVHAAFLLSVPSEIRLNEYATHRLAFKLPFLATVRNETAAVFKINDRPVEDNLTVSLQDPITIQTDAGGTAEMTINAFGLPLKKVVLDIVPDLEVIPCGMTIGVRINTNGIMVLGLGSFSAEDGSTCKPCDGKLKPGDLILSVDGADMKSKEELIQTIADSQGEVIFRIKRDGEIIETPVTPAKSARDNTNRIGCWVRDSTQGIGTITYYNPSTHAFGALGHGIMDVDTKRLMSVKNGVIMSSRVTSVKKGAKGTPGELEGSVEKERVLGNIKTNSPHGIYGEIDPSMSYAIPGDPMKIATQSQVHEGPAIIRTNVASNKICDYDIYIESINRYAADETKGMVIRITDPTLLKLTNGIVQGMSGSPIIQDGKLIGAVTHVFVQDPAKGYGIFIENMIRQEKQKTAEEQDTEAAGQI